MAFETNVFVNCPFDEDYYSVLRPLLFTIIYLGLKPRIATERLDSGEARVGKIIELIRESKYAIHDLSRIRAATSGEYFRLNMPFELGVDIGCRLFKPGKWRDKVCLILVAERHKYQAAISDLSNSDVAVHNNNAEDVVTEIRNWLNTACRLRAVGPSRIWDAFNEFMAADFDRLRALGFSPKNIERLPIPELMENMHEWIETNV